MSEVTRFNLAMYTGGMEPDKDGEWVRWDAHVAALEAACCDHESSCPMCGKLIFCGPADDMVATMVANPPESASATHD
jgi:hypothetical protein